MRNWVCAVPGSMNAGNVKTINETLAEFNKDGWQLVSVTSPDLELSKILLFFEKAN